MTSLHISFLGFARAVCIEYTHIFKLKLEVNSVIWFSLSKPTRSMRPVIALIFLSADL